MPSARSPRQPGSPGCCSDCPCGTRTARLPGLVVSNPLCPHRLPVRPGVLLKAEDQSFGRRVCFGSVRGCGRPGFTRPPDPAQIGEGAWRAFKANSRELELILKKRPWVQTASVDKLSIKVRVPWTIAFQAVSAVFRASSDASAVRISDCPAEPLSF